MAQANKRLADLGLEIPSLPPVVANYAPFVVDRDVVYISGQLSVDANGGVKGAVGVDVDVEMAEYAAKLCGLNLLAQFQDACDGDLDRVEQIIKLNGFVQSGPDFSDIPKVINGCSDLMVDVFGDKGKHARAAVGVYRLPLGFSVEVDATIRIKQ